MDLSEYFGSPVAPLVAMAAVRPADAKVSESWRGRVYAPPTFLAYIAILCFERQYPKQNGVIRLKSNILTLPKFFASLQKFGLATPLARILKNFSKFNLLTSAPTHAFYKGSQLYSTPAVIDFGSTVEFA